MRQLRIVLVLSTILWLGMSAVGSDLKGVVRSESRKPIKQVWVLSPPKPFPGVGTAQDGSFKLKRHGAVVYFIHSEYQLLKKTVDPSVRRMEVILKERIPGQWIIPECSASERERRVGFNLKFPIPGGTVVKRGRDIDYTDLRLGFGAGDHQPWLWGFSGPNVYTYNSVPPVREILDAEEFNELSWMSGTMKGLDFRGRLANGTYWRELKKRWGETWRYETTDKQTSVFLDKILDAACYSADPD